MSDSEKIKHFFNRNRVIKMQIVMMIYDLETESFQRL
jgi:hypothetical protein